MSISNEYFHQQDCEYCEYCEESYREWGTGYTEYKCLLTDYDCYPDSCPLSFRYRYELNKESKS